MNRIKEWLVEARSEIIGGLVLLGIGALYTRILDLYSSDQSLFFSVGGLLIGLFLMVMVPRYHANQNYKLLSQIIGIIITLGSFIWVALDASQSTELQVATAVLETIESEDISQLSDASISYSTPEIILEEVTRVVEVPIEVTREVTQFIEVPIEVTREVITTLVITAMPTPEDTPTPQPALREYSLDLISYSPGDIPIDLAEEVNELVVREQGEKCIGGLSDTGTLRISSLELTGRFDINLRGEWVNSKQIIALTSEDGSVVEISFEAPANNINYWYINFGNKLIALNQLVWEIRGTNNRLRLEINTEARTAKLFVGNDFFETVEIEPGAVFNRLAITNISQEDCLYELSARLVQE